VTPEEWRHGLSACIGVLERVLDERPEKVHADLVAVSRGVVALRDALIAARAESTTGGLPVERLPEVNAILSMVTGAEFPLVGVRWQRMKKAEEQLRALLEETRAGGA
jgi:hypothetical protein